MHGLLGIYYFLSLRYIAEYEREFLSSKTILLQATPSTLRLNKS